MTLIRILTIVFLVVSIGCTPVAQPQPMADPRDPAEDLFTRYLEGPPAERPEAFASLRENHPESPWFTRARLFRDLTRNRETQSAKIKQFEKENIACRQEFEALQKESAKLREDLEKLRNLLIDMELRGTK